jgi:hypothetical protein
MNENLVGYILNALDDDAQLAVERYLRTDPDAPRQVELLRRALAPLDADASPPELPPGLRYRTLALIAEHACRPAAATPVPPPAIIPMPRRRWRRADALVAAAVVLVSFSLVPSAVVNVNQYRDRVYCQNNLRAIHHALMGYCDQNDQQLPKVDANPPGNFAGVYVPILHGAGLLDDKAQVTCAALKKPAPRRMTIEDLHSLPPEQLAQYMQELRDLYAYGLGYYDSKGVLHGFRRGEDSDLTPIVADNPPFEQPPPGMGMPGNSLNHARKGQNVLHLGGDVQFLTTRYLPGRKDDDIYLNDNGHVAAGIHREDAVLGASRARPVPVSFPALPAND